MPPSQFGKRDGIIENLPPPSLKAILIKVSIVSLKLYPGVGEAAPEMLGWRFLSKDWTVLTMDCDGYAWMDTSLSRFFHPVPRPQYPLPYKELILL